MKRDLGHVLARYQQGLEAQIALLETLAHCASAQRDASLQQDTQKLEATLAERDHAMESLLALEQSQAQLRQELLPHLDDVRTLQGFEQVRQLHHDADRRLQDILTLDQETRSGLEQSESARRSTVQTLEAGEATLAAYRKILSPFSPVSSIVDQHG